MGDSEQQAHVEGEGDVTKVDAPALVVDSQNADATPDDVGTLDLGGEPAPPLTASDAGPGNPEAPGAPDTAGKADSEPQDDAQDTSDADEAQKEADLRAGRAVERDPVRAGVGGAEKDNRQDVPDELKADGQIHGGEQHEAPEEQGQPEEPYPSRANFAQPVFVDGAHRRSDDDALEGHAVDVVSGKHKGRFGVFFRVEEYAREHGYPKKIVVRTIDHKDGDEYVGVDYADVRPSPIRNNRL